jgi:uncharacterized caspase-like protein
VVDTDIPPLTLTRNPMAAALVVGIEDYPGVMAPARFARRDAKIFKRYLTESLGVPRENVITLLDAEATTGSIRTAVEGQLGSIIERGKSDVYVYYAGHGAPDVSSKSAFLLPFDGNAAFPKTSCYALTSLYDALKRLGARTTTVVIDSSFSGLASRSDVSETLVANTRPLFLQLASDPVAENAVVFLGARGAQRNLAHPAVQHGLFTYYFLRGLQGAADVDADGQISVQELDQYLSQQVPREARRARIDQTPLTLGSVGQRVLLQKAKP